MAWLREDTRGMTLERRMNWLRKNEWPDFKKTHGLTPKSHGSTSKRLADSEKIHDLTSRTLMDWLRTVSWADFKNTYGLISKILKAQVRKKTHGLNSWRLTTQSLSSRTFSTWLWGLLWLDLKKKSDYESPDFQGTHGLSSRCAVPDQYPLRDFLSCPARELQSYLITWFHIFYPIVIFLSLIIIMAIFCLLRVRMRVCGSACLSLATPTRPQRLSGRLSTSKK